MCTCSETNWVEIAGVIVAAVIPIIIMIITLCSQKKKHLEQLSQINEKNRIDAMPVLDFHYARVESVEKHEASTVILQDISLVNKGNGTAINVGLCSSNAKDKTIITQNTVSSVGGIALKKNQEGNYSFEIQFSDLYGNAYTESIIMRLEETNLGYEMQREKTTLPVLMNTECADHE